MKIEFEWKPASEIPERGKNNNLISPRYLVKCGYGEDGCAIIGYANFSYVTNKWMKCYRVTEPGVWDVESWTDKKL